jgi:lipopolysaccharide export system protein LptA
MTTYWRAFLLLSVLTWAVPSVAAPRSAAPQPGAPHPGTPHPGTPAPAKPVAPATTPATAGTAQPHDEGTIEITADRDLEWLQQDHAYIARGNAVAKRGAITLMGDTLIAYYRPLPAKAPASGAPRGAPAASGQPGIDSGNTEIWRVVAEGHVHVLSADRDAFGDHADYDKDKSVIVLTGQALKASSLLDVVTARDSLEYWQDLEIAVARGNALIVQVNGNTLAGDVVAGHFVKNAQGASTLKTISAKGHVVVTTLTDIVHGDEGTYDLDAKRTVLFGNVKATRGQSELEGQSAEVNMVTGISQVFPGPGQRVHALFVRQNAPQGPVEGQNTASGQNTPAGQGASGVKH